MRKIKIQLIRNATLKLWYAEKTFLIDPMLSPKNSIRSFVVSSENLNPTVDLPISVKEIMEGVDAILLTHTHPDHFDDAAVEIIPKDIPFFLPPNDHEEVKKAGFTNTIAIDSSHSYGHIQIKRTTGKHGPVEILDLLGEVSGYIFKADGYPTVYIIGDCLWDKEIEGFIENNDPDIIITNSGGALFRGGSERILMNEKETILVAKKAPKATIIATHMESLDHCKTTRALVQREAQKEQVNILTPEDGEVIDL